MRCGPVFLLLLLLLLCVCVAKWFLEIQTSIQRMSSESNRKHHCNMYVKWISKGDFKKCSEAVE